MTHEVTINGPSGARILAGSATAARRLGLAALVITLGFASVSAAVAQEARVTPLMTQSLERFDSPEAAMVMVEYAPGGSDGAHRHHAYTFVYVLEGAVVMQVQGGREVTLGPGQTFYESRDDVHTVSRNASATQPAKFLVFFVKQKGAPLTVPAR